MNNIEFDVIIVGGSFAGLSAALSLGRSVRNVLVIDSGEPCNKKASESHNFLTQDGETPAAIALKARKQLEFYTSVKLLAGTAKAVIQKDNYFELTTALAETFTAKKILFATGIKDLMPDIPGFADCWGKSIIHCPYCHGYEVYQEKLAVFSNGNDGFEFSKLISNWSNDLTLYTNGPSTLNHGQQQKLKDHNINIVQTKIAAINCVNGNIQTIDFVDGTLQPIQAVFARVAFEQHCNILEQLGCALTEHGHIMVDDFYATTVPGIYAAGDNTTAMRSVAAAVAAGSAAGAHINKILISDEF
ncbi:thioredoxin reductase [Mucilaginibacter sp. UYNi724]